MPGSGCGAQPDPRSPQGRIYPLACLIAIAVCAFTAAGERPVYRRGPADQAGQPGRPGSAERPWDPIAGRYRAPDEKTIRVVLDLLDPRALLGPGPRGRVRPGGPLSASVLATVPGGPLSRRERGRGTG
jgi:hypothetical protein